LADDLFFTPGSCHVGWAPAGRRGELRGRTSGATATKETEWAHRNLKVILLRFEEGRDN
jgi:hypothetical protein